MKVKEVTNIINGEIFVKNSNVILTNISSPENSNEESIVFIFNKKYLSSFAKKKVGLIVASSSLKNFFSDHNNILLVDNPYLSFARLSFFFENQFLSTFNKNKSFKVGSNFISGKNTFIDNNVILGDNVCLGNNVSIHKNVIIGNDVKIDSGSVIGSEGFGNAIDDDSKWVHITHLGGVRIGNNVAIGANVTIDRGTLDNTVISNGVIIDNLVHIAHNVIIGENTAIAAKVGIAGSCKIGKRNMIGGMVGIVDHINTADDVIISATSTVNKDIKESGAYTGIMPISKHSNWKRIAFWITKLDKIVEFINFRKR